MKKLMLALAALALLATAGFAATGVSVQWTTAYGIYDHAAVDLTSTTTGGILDSYAITWQLIYSVNSVAEAPDASNGANGWVSLTGDDEVWATRTFVQDDGSASDGTEWDLFVYFAGTGDIQYNDTTWLAGDVGYIFQRVFEGTPAVNSWYFDSTPVALDADPVTYQESYIEGSPSASEGVQPDQQMGGAVPEPATMGLLGLGALVMAIRRRRA